MLFLSFFNCNLMAIRCCNDWYEAELTNANVLLLLAAVMLAMVACCGRLIVPALAFASISLCAGVHV